MTDYLIVQEIDKNNRKRFKKLMLNCCGRESKISSGIGEKSTKNLNIFYSDWEIIVKYN